MAGNDGQGSYSGAGGLGPQYGEITGSVIHRQRNDWGMGLIVASERAQLSHWPLTTVRAHRKCRKVANNDVPTWSNTFRHFGKGGG